MARNASTKSAKARTKATGLRKVLHAQGRSMAWLSRTTGYSVSQIGRVARGEHPGSDQFWALMRATLGEEVAA